MGPAGGYAGHPAIVGHPGASASQTIGVTVNSNGPIGPTGAFDCCCSAPVSTLVPVAPALCARF